MNQKPNYEQQMVEEMQKKEQEEKKQVILSQILSPEARDRLMKIKVVKPQKAAGIENSLIRAAQQGIIKNIVSEKQLVALLERQSEQQGQAKITFKRRGIDDEW